MDIKRILMALLKTIRDIVIIFSVIIMLGIIGKLISLYLGISIYYYFYGLLLLVSIIIILISYYQEGGKNE